MRRPEYKFSISSATPIDLWLQMKELLAIIPRRKVSAPNTHLEPSTPALLNCINPKAGIVPLQSCYYFLI